ncbi:hypothetical protein [Bacteriovorax sp. DB6_IX]|uniref:hypothetical protein n=1 Tax=Bacteriovorax sp. DB6_IX TaxID=1353530 RepID=UPI00038A50AD|nr:hypothetical protein [Bacteriovorax sp. DB6_IX]EQC51049.1 hypothetical protein M901_2612 [Bacteriovorax sp. DB6_IX]
MDEKRNPYFYFLLILVPFFAFVKGPYYPLDLWNWVQSGRLIIEQGSFLPQFPFTFLETQSIGFSNYLISILYYYLHKSLGDFGLVSFHHVALLVLLTMTYERTIRETVGNASTYSRFFLYLMTFGIIVSCSERPGFLSLFPFVLNFSFLIKRELEKVDYLWVILIFLLWLNLHGSFILFFVMWGTRGLGQLLHKDYRSFFQCFALSILAIALIGCNPYGYKILEFHAKNIEISKVRMMMEYRPIFEQDIFPLYILVSAVLLHLLWLRSKVIGLKNVLSLCYFAPFMLATLFSGRVFIYFIFSLPYVIKSLDLIKIERESVNHAKVRPAFYILIVLTILSFGPVKKSLFPQMRLWSHGGIPKIVSYLDRKAERCAILNDWEYGSHLSILESKIAIDGRNVIYPQSSFEIFKKLIHAKMEKEVYQKYDICYLVVNEKERGPLIELLDATVVMKEHEATLLKVNYE